MAAEPPDEIAARRGPPAFAFAARVVRLLAWAQLAIAGVLFVEATMVYGAEIIMRGMLNTSYPEYYEVVGISFIWIFLLSAGALYARDQDVVIDMIYAHVPKRGQPWWVLVVQLSITATMALTLYYTLWLIDLQSHTPTPLLRVPEAIKWYPLAIASASIVFTSLVEAWRCAIWIATGERPDVWHGKFFDQEDDEEEIALL